MEEKDYAGARADAEEVLRLKPNDSRGARLLADTYLALNQNSRVTQQLADIAASRPKAASVQYLMGQWCMKNGQLLQARKAFEAALSSEPNLLPAMLNLAEIDRIENRPEAARARLQQILAQHPGNLEALLLLAGIDGEIGDLAGETAAYKSAIAIDNSNVFALNNLACALTLEHPEEALPLAERAVEIAPQNAAVQDTLGWIYYRKRQYDAAIDHLRAAVQREPTPRREFHLAVCYMKSGHSEPGEELLRSALKQEPNLPKSERGW